jgi:hypothetical protein
VRSLANSDLPMILDIVVVVCIAVVIANLIVDLLFGALDPARSHADEGRRDRVGYDAVSHCAQACS